MIELEEYLLKKEMLARLKEQRDKLNDQITATEREKGLHETNFLLTPEGEAMPEQFVYQFGQHSVLVKKHSTYIQTCIVPYFQPSEL